MTAKKKKKISKLERAKKNEYSSYWRNQAEELFMARYRGLPCQVCTTHGITNTKKTHGHHLIPKGRCVFHLMTPQNILILCPSHHLLSKDIAAHSMSILVIDRFMEWMKEHFPERVEWIKEHEWDSGRVNYKEAFDKLQENIA